MLFASLTQEKHKEVLQALARGLDDIDWEIRSSFIEAARSMYPLFSQKDKEGALEILTYMNDTKVFTRFASRQWYVAFHPFLPQEVQEAATRCCIMGLKDEDVGVRLVSAQALEKLLPELPKERQEEALTNLTMGISDTSAVVCCACIRVLGKLYPFLPQGKQKKVVGALLPKLKDKSWWVRDACAEFFEGVCPSLPEGQHREVLEALEGSLSDFYSRVRNPAAQALKGLYSLLLKADQSKVAQILLKKMTHVCSYTSTRFAEAFSILCPLLLQADQRKGVELLLAGIEDDTKHEADKDAVIRIGEITDDNPVPNQKNIATVIVVDVIDNDVRATYAKALGRVVSSLSLTATLQDGLPKLQELLKKLPLEPSQADPLSGGVKKNENPKKPVQAMLLWYSDLEIDHLKGKQTPATSARDDDKGKEEMDSTGN